MLIGYARVSTLEQDPAPQAAELRAAGCLDLRTERASGADRRRPVLARLLAEAGPGDTVVVVRIDRLARSLIDLLDIVARLEARGAGFRSLRDPIDTATAQGRFALQVLGAAAEFERALIRERTAAGVAEARARGRRPGNPALATKDPAGLARLRAGRREAWLARLERDADQWVPLVRRHRPALRWEAVARLVDAARPEGAPPWSAARLRRAARAFVAEGFLPEAVLAPAPRAAPAAEAPVLLAAMKGADPSLTLAAMGRRLEDLRVPAPRGGARWGPSSVAAQLEAARRMGLLP